MDFKRLVDLHREKGMSPDNVAWTDEEKYFRYQFIHEEALEFMDAKTSEEEVDGLIDCIIVCMGTLDRMGHANIAEQAFNIVMDANDKKESGPNPNRNFFPVDLIKPEGWVAPNKALKTLIEQGGAKQTSEEVLKERGSRYGKFEDNAYVTQTIFAAFMKQGDLFLGMRVREAVHMVAHKTARMICGDHLYLDNTMDIIGYLKLYAKSPEWYPGTTMSILSSRFTEAFTDTCTELRSLIEHVGKDMDEDQADLLIAMWRSLTVEIYRSFELNVSLDRAQQLHELLEKKNG